MKWLVALTLGLSLSACGSVSQVITTEKLTVVEPDRSLYNCPNISRYPKPETLTDAEVARLLLSMERSNSECRRTMKAIQTFIEQAKQRTN